jgi:hypothetical protein
MFEQQNIVWIHSVFTLRGEVTFVKFDNGSMYASDRNYAV